MKDHMNTKKYIILPILLLLVPACSKKQRICPIHPVAPVVVEDVAPCQPQDTNIPGFALEEAENPFTTNKVAADDIALTQAEQNQDSSAAYGFNNIYFDFDRYEIRPDQRAELENDLSIAKDLAGQGYDISVEGHSCNFAGDTQYNMALSEKRAKAVADALKENGVEAGKIHTVGYGSMRPLVPAGDKEQQAPNRRVELHAYKK